VENYILSIRTVVAKFYLHSKDDENIPHDFEDDDKGLSLSLKLHLKRDSSDWSEVCRLWEKTCKIRQEDVKSLSNLEFMQDFDNITYIRLFDCLCI